MEVLRELAEHIALEVDDDGSYWHSGDLDALREQRRFQLAALEDAALRDPSLQVAVPLADGRFIDALRDDPVAAFVVPASAVDRAGALIGSVQVAVDRWRRLGVPDSALDDAVLSDALAFLEQQLRNGGCSQVVFNTRGVSSGGPTPGVSSGGPTPGVSSGGPTPGVPAAFELFREGLRLVGTLAQQEALARLASVVAEVPEGDLAAFLSSAYFGENPTRDRIDAGSDWRTFAVDELAERHAAWVRGHPGLVVVPDEDWSVAVLRHAADRLPPLAAPWRRDGDGVRWVRRTDPTRDPRNHRIAAVSGVRTPTTDLTDVHLESGAVLRIDEEDVRALEKATGTEIGDLASRGVTAPHRTALEALWAPILAARAPKLEAFVAGLGRALDAALDAQSVDPLRHYLSSDPSVRSTALWLGQVAVADGAPNPSLEQAVTSFVHAGRVWFDQTEKSGAVRIFAQNGAFRVGVAVTRDGRVYTLEGSSATAVDLAPDVRRVLADELLEGIFGGAGADDRRIATLENVLRHHPGDPEASERLAERLVHSDPARARALLGSATDPTDAEAWIARGNLWRALRDDGSAVACFDRAVEHGEQEIVDGGAPDDHWCLASALALRGGVGDAERALEHVEAAVRGKPSLAPHLAADSSLASIASHPRFMGAVGAG